MAKVLKKFGGGQKIVHDPATAGKVEREEKSNWARWGSGNLMSSPNRTVSILILVLTLCSSGAFAFAPRMPSPSAPAMAHTKANGSTTGSAPLSCLDQLRGLANSTGDVHDLLENMAVPLKMSIDEYANNYGNLCVVRDFSEEAQRRGMGRHADYLCYRDVKKLMDQEAPWMISHHIDSRSAYMAKDDLADEGLIDILPTHLEYASDPSLAPPGAVIVYERNGYLCPSFMPRFVCRVSSNGDIQVRTQDGFYSGFFSPRAMLDQPAGILMRVSAVMLKPLTVTSFNKSKNCFETKPDNR